MPVIQQGSTNINSLKVPNVYVQIQPPQVTAVNGVPTNILGMVGTASWGLVNSPVTVGSLAEFQSSFGGILTDPNDLGTAVSIAALQGANNMLCVRVTDGTDQKATIDILDTATVPQTGLTLTALYSGTVGNTITATIGAGSNSSLTATTYKISILRPGYVTEVFDNIGGSGAEIYENMVTAINMGQTGRSRSFLVVASLPTTESILAPALDTYTLEGGTNGNSGVTSTELLGTDGTTRTGLYSLRGSKASMAFLVGNTDNTTWTYEAAYGLSEGTYMILTGPSGEYADISTAIGNKQSAGLDCYDVKLLLGDWCYFNDTINGQLRMVSPQAYVAGRLANLSTEQSSLNNQIYGIVGTEATYNSRTYSDADLILLINAGIDLISIQSPGGAYFSCRVGCNTSSNILINGDNYTRLTNYIAYSLNAAAGVFIGKPITDTLMSSANGMITNWLYNMQNQDMIDSFSVQLDSTNNPQSQTSMGMMQADVKVKYFAILVIFLINVEGSQATVTVQSVQPTTTTNLRG